MMSDEERILDDAELDQIAAEELAPSRVLPYETNIVTLGGREFEIDEPDIGITVRIINIIGILLNRGEKTALRSIERLARQAQADGLGASALTQPSTRAVLFGVLAALNVEDLIAFGSTVLQFEDDREGRKWLRSVKLELAPLVRAFWLNVAQGTDLMEALRSFFVGLDVASDILPQIVS